jgi:hypothetical protein
MNMKVHVCMCLASGGNESPRYHNKFKRRETRARARQMRSVSMQQGLALLVQEE